MCVCVFVRACVCVCVCARVCVCVMCVMEIRRARDDISHERESKLKNVA